MNSWIQSQLYNFHSNSITYLSIYIKRNIYIKWIYLGILQILLDVRLSVSTVDSCGEVGTSYLNAMSLEASVSLEQVALIIFHAQSKYDANKTCCISINGSQMAQQAVNFCTWHDSWAVVTCAKIYCHHFFTILIIINRYFSLNLNFKRDVVSEMGSWAFKVWMMHDMHHHGDR